MNATDVEQLAQNPFFALSINNAKRSNYKRVPEARYRGIICNIRLVEKETAKDTLLVVTVSIRGKDYDISTPIYSLPSVERTLRACHLSPIEAYIGPDWRKRFEQDVYESVGKEIDCLWFESRQFTNRVLLHVDEKLDVVLHF